MANYSPTLENPLPEITWDKTTDEFGEPKYGWFCTQCEKGDFHNDPDTAVLVATDHSDTH